ncbi:hypothetical protein FOVSG1_001733 [Fusarium oxysporum f. sp. vasinfectum]
MTDRNAATMGKSAKQEPAKGDDGKAVNRDKNSNATPSGNHKAPTKKRRKVNHACVYCRRSHMTCDLERPCTRCIKRNIGHLCHDEPRDADSKKAKSVQSTQSIQAPSVVDESDAQSDMARSSISSTMGPPPPTFDTTRQRGSKSFGGVLGQGSPLSIVQPGQVSGLQGNALNNGNSNANQFAGFQDAWMTAQNHFHDMHSYHPNYMIASEVTHEFNLLNDFLHTSLLDDGSVPPEEQQSPAFKRSSQSQSEMLPRFGNNANTSMGAGGSNTMSNMTEGSMLPPPPNIEGKNIPRPGSVVPADKAREYYLQAADPSGNDTPEERMARVLKAKYDAGLLKPFNYINGYSRLGAYLNSHITTASREKILRTIARFRPAFREKAHALTDIELVYVEMWFEKQLMDYDRVFASMAVPACCWRRTGEIFRGNKEMAELIGVSVAQLRDGKIALHEILTEESMVRYWEEFGTIAFDPAHETLLTACSLKNPTPGSTHPVVKCCFSFMIRRDEHKLPALIVARVCVESSDLDGALLSMAKAADYIDRLKKIDNLTTEDRVQVQKIEAEYLTMRCALSWKQGRLDVAEHIIQDEPLTRYLMFRVSLLTWDHDLGRQCVEFLGKFAEKSQCRDILYACTRDAQHVGDKLMTLEALKAVAETFDAEGSLTINLPSILRCTIRLIHSLESQEGSEGDRSPELAEETCRIFERAGEHAKLEPKDEQGCRVFTVSELHWFRKNAYNIGVTKCHVWGLWYLIRIFRACLAFVDCYPSDLPSEDDTDLRLMSVRCHFVVAAALISQARTGDKVDEQLQQYLETRRHISEFDTLFDAHFRNDSKSQVYPDLLAKLSTLFVFDFESAVCLKSWDDLRHIIRKARICKDEMMYKAMGDCLLRSEASGNVVYGTMRLIINEIFSLEQFDNQQLAKYMRCMFQAILPLDDNLAFQVVEQAVQIAREGSQMQKPFPAEDLDWIIATTFNHAIDILARGDEDLCQQWAMKALDMTEYMDDNGDMRDMLRERVVKLDLSKGAPS